MYSTREKLIHFNQLVNPQAVEADLALLHKKNPQSTDFVRFDHAPEKNSEDILFALLDVCEHDEIVRNRREFFATENKDTDSNSGGEGNGTPLKGTGTESPTDGEGNGTPLEGTGTENPIDGEGNGTPLEGTGTENPIDGEGNGTPLEGTGTENPIDGEGNGTPLEGTGTENPTDGEGNDTPSENTGAETDNVDNSSEEGKGNQPKKPATPKKKKKSTRK